MVNNFPPSESNIFPEYIIPALSPFLQDQEDFVREVYAENLAQLAETAKRFLEKTQVRLVLLILPCNVNGCVCRW